MNAFTKHKGVVFTELSDINFNYTLIKTISVNIEGVFTQSQTKTLDDLKDELAREVLCLGGNALKSFKYGQKSVSFLGSIMSIDDVKWHGSGDVIKIIMDKK